MTNRPVQYLALAFSKTWEFNKHTLQYMTTLHKHIKPSSLVVEVFLCQKTRTLHNKQAHKQYLSCQVCDQQFARMVFLVYFDRISLSALQGRTLLNTGWLHYVSIITRKLAHLKCVYGPSCPLDKEILCYSDVNVNTKKRESTQQPHPQATPIFYCSRGEKDFSPRL